MLIGSVTKSTTGCAPKPDAKLPFLDKKRRVDFTCYCYKRLISVSDAHREHNFKWLKLSMHVDFQQVQQNIFNSQVKINNCVAGWSKMS